MNNFNVNPEAVKLLEASRGETLPAVSCVAQKMRPIIDKQNHIKLKGSLLLNKLLFVRVLVKTPRKEQQSHMQ